MWTKLFWKDTAERAIFTAAQVLIALLVVDGTNLLTLDWAATGVTVLTAVVLAVLKAIVAASTVSDSISPASVLKEE